MDLATIEMDRNKARAAFLDYRRAVRERHDEEDAQIMRGYRALAQGKQLIRLSDTLRAGGSFIKEFRHRRQQSTSVRLSRLSVCRANAKTCYTQGVDTDGSTVFAADAPERERHNRNRKDVFRVGSGVFEPADTVKWRFSESYRAIVPNVPPPLRPVHSLAGYMILWEADWELHAPPTPPGDPALLKHIGGDLYAVVAVWDLTGLERAVLAARAEVR